MRLGFIHVRKNAGTSLIDFFDRTGVDLKVVNRPGDAIGCVTFAVARNPYTRCVSAWKYCSSTKHRPLLDCLRNPPQITDIDIDKNWLKPGHDYRHFTKTQSHFIFDNGLRPSHILSFENLEHDLQNLCQMYDIPFVKLHYYNVGQYNHQLTDLEYEAIYQSYKEDFDNLGYNK